MSHPRRHDYTGFFSGGISMGGRGSNRMDRLTNGGRKATTIESQIRDLAKKGVMPKYIAGGNADTQNRAFEAINKAYKYTAEQKKYLSTLNITDQKKHNRLYIRKPDGSVSLQTYPKGASQSAKDGALKMYVYGQRPKVRA